MAKRGRYVYAWPRPMVTVDALIYKKYRGKVQVLLIERGNNPYKGMWAIPGGFVDMDEDLVDAAKRELEEETGLKGIELEQMHTFGKPGRDPRGRNITICFIGELKKTNVRAKAGDDASKAKWFDIKKLPENLAFDHEEVLKFAAAELKERNYLAEDFTDFTE